MDYQEDYLPRNQRRRQAKPKNTFWAELWSWIWSFIVSFVMLAGIYFFIGKPFTVSGSSMYPTLHNGDRMFMSKLGDIQRFDVVVLKAPDEDKEYIKRVIGMPGDEISMKEGVLYINGKRVEQPFINQEPLAHQTVFIDDFTLLSLIGDSKVPADQYFVLGDNRGVSRDSRIIGFVDKKAIEGKAVFTFWPLDRIGGQTDYAYLYPEK